MVPIMNMPFLERTLRRLKAAGIDDVILPAGYLPEAITSYFGDGSSLGMKITYVIEKTPLGTAGALKNIEHLIAGPFFVLNGDVLTSLDLGLMLAAHKKKGGLGMLHLIRIDDPSAFGCVVHDPDGKITAFIEKPAPGEAPTNEVNAGTYLFERAILDLIPAGRPVSIERETFPLAITGGRALYAHTTDDYWIDLGRPEAYLASHRHIFDGMMTLGISPGAEGPGATNAPAGALIPPVYVGRDVRLAPGAVIGPYAVVGDGCSVGDGATVKDSILWDGVEIERGAVVDWSIIASRATVGANAVVKPGSVIGHDAVIAPGSVIEENARIAR